MGVLAVVTTNDLYQDCDLQFWGNCALCELPPHRHGLDGQQNMEGEKEEMTGRVERPSRCF